MLDAVSEKPYFNPVSGFTKLFSSLIFSTVWREEMHVKVLWITMLAMANRNGEVLASVPGLADAARVSLRQCREGLKKLSAPDPDSRTKDFEGRRIVEVDGGWRLLNYPKYRAIQDADERRIQTREAVRRHRAREKKVDPLTVSKVSVGKPRKAQAEAEAEADAETTTSKTLVAQGATLAPLPILAGNGKPPKARAVAEIIAHIQEVGQRTDQRLATEQLRQLQAEIVFSYWAAKFGKQKPLLDAKRWRTIQQRLTENEGDVSELLYALDGASRDDWITGRDPKAPRKYDGIESIFRDREQVERFASTCGGFNRQEPHPMVQRYAAASDD